MSNKKVLITGGAGFIGSHLCKRLLNNGDEVLCVDNFFTGSKQNILDLMDNKRFEFIRHDITFPLYLEVDQMLGIGRVAQALLDGVQHGGAAQFELLGPETGGPSHVVEVDVPHLHVRTARCIDQFAVDCLKAQIQAGGDLLDGMVIWGDVAYKNSMFFSPRYWRDYFRPWVEAMVRESHDHGLPVIYHGCGNVSLIFDDFVEMGVDAYNPLEAKADLHAVDLRKKYGHRIAFCGNSDMQIWESGDEAAIRREVLTKLNAAKGGGMIFQSDHSVTSRVSGRTYDTIVKLVREVGVYPLDLGEYDVAV